MRFRRCKNARLGKCTSREESGHAGVPIVPPGYRTLGGEGTGSADVTSIYETEPRTVPRARHSVMAALIDAGLGIDTIETAALLTTELAANVVQHSMSQSYTLDVDIDLTRVHVEIGDADDRFPLRPLREPADTEHGRGLSLVDALASRWGVRSGETGKVVWFELPVHP